jgi:signal transduction histidine kinase/CheY-like chemotaxis protein
LVIHIVAGDMQMELHDATMLLIAMLLVLLLLMLALWREYKNTKNNKRLLEDLRKSKKDMEAKARGLQAAVYHGGLFYWEYYPQKAVAIQSDVGTRVFDVQQVMDNFPASWLIDGRIYQDDIAVFMEMDKKVKEGATECECNVREKINGRYEWRQLKYTSVEKDGKTGANVKVFGTDISIQKEVELEKLYSEQVNYRKILGLKSLLYAKLNLTKNIPEGVFTHLNVTSPNMQNITDYYPTVDAFMDHLHYHVIRNGKPTIEFQQAGSADYLLQMLANGRTHYETEFIYNFRDGYSRWVNAIMDILHNPLTGDAECFIYFNDIEAQKFMEQQDQERIAEALKKAKRASAYKSQFLSKVSHEMRTPLNAILGFCQLGKNEKNIFILQDYLNKIGFSGDMLLNMVNNILDMDKASGEKIKLYLSEVDTGEFFNKITRTAEPAFSEKHINFTLDAEKCEKQIILIDEKRFSQIIFNLLNNAAKFTKLDGHVTLRVVSSPAEDGKLPLIVTVKDDGIGMSEDFQQRLFQPFAQEIESTTSSYNGVGLSLSLTKQLLTEMGGSISCHSEKNQGSEFVIKVRFPIITETKKEKEIQSNKSNKELETAIAGTKCLIAEDIKINYLIAKKLLENMKCQIEWVKNGKEAVDAFLNMGPNYYDFILMDVRMPIMDGLSATKAIRNSQQADAKTIPIIAMTANALDVDVEASKAAGMNAHLSKPIDADLMYQDIYNCLQKNTK